MRATLWFRQVVAARLIRQLGGALYLAAWVWRRLLVGTRFIAVTGSFGKTTAKEGLARILSSRHRTFRSLNNQNAHGLVSLNVLRVRPWHRFAVFETAASRPGMLGRVSRLLRPDIVILLGVGNAHLRSFRSLEATAREKMQLASGLRRGGTVIVNADEPRFAALPSIVPDGMAYRVLRFGSSPEADLRAEAVEHVWPARLSVRVSAGNETRVVGTRLLGRQWLASVAASLLAARCCGIPLAEAAAVLAQVKPFPARMQPVRMPGGAVLIRDEYDGAPDAFRVALEYFSSASAARRIAILGDISDSKYDTRRRLRELGRMSAAMCQLVVGIGEHAHHIEKGALAAGLPPDGVRAFLLPEQAVPFLRAELREGDLVLVKGRSHERLSRAVFSLAGDVKCKKLCCKKSIECDFCWELGMRPADRDKIEPL